MECDYCHSIVHDVHHLNYCRAYERYQKVSKRIDEIRAEKEAREKPKSAYED